MATVLEKLLGQRGVKLEELSKEEVATLTGWINVIQEKQLTVEKIKSYISTLKHQVEQELTKYDLSNSQDLYLKARLRNLMLLEGFLSTPDVAKAQLDMAISNISKEEG